MGNILGSPTEPVKMLLIGDSGAGKTGAITALAKVGYEVVYADFDKGLDVVKDIAKKNPEAAANIYFESFTDKLKGSSAGVVSDGIPSGFTNFLNWMNNAKGNGYDFGPVEKWPDTRVLVIDSLTHCCSAAMRWVLTMAGRANAHPQLQDWGNAMTKIETLLAMLYSDAVKCSVIVTAHVDYLSIENVGIIRGLPMSLGQKLSPKIPSYFNTMILAKTVGMGANARRTLRTKPEGVVEVKCPVVGGALPEELPIETGLADIFKAIRGANPK